MVKDVAFVVEEIPSDFRDFYFALPVLEQAGFFLWPSVEGNQLSLEEKEYFTAIKPSGCVFFRRNFHDLTSAKRLIADTRKYSTRSHTLFPMTFVSAIDEEGGRVSRLPPPFVRGRPAMSFALEKDERGLENQVLYQALLSRGLGINCLLAPVADILTLPQNTAIGDRAFGTDAETVSHFSSIVNRVLLQENMFSCAKHFPGHGNTVADSHTDFCRSDVEITTLEEREWLPFRHLIHEKVSFIMAAHVVVPALDPLYPATLSEKILSGCLRERLGFQGLILSDDLRMRAIALHYKQQSRRVEASVTEDIKPSSHEGIIDDSFLMVAAIDALKAGCDILLSCQSLTKESLIAEAIARKIQSEASFQELMLKKAWKIFQTLSTNNTENIS